MEFDLMSFWLGIKVTLWGGLMLYLCQGLVRGVWWEADASRRRPRARAPGSSMTPGTKRRGGDGQAHSPLGASDV